MTLKAQLMVIIFRDKVFLKLGCINDFFKHYYTFNRLYYSVDITFICIGKPKNL